MSLVYYIIPLILGAMAVLQTGMNRRLAQDTGLAQAALVSNLMTVLLCVVLYLVASSQTSPLPDLYKVKGQPLWQIKWWYFVPGLCGAMLVAGAPFALHKLGAVTFFICFIVAQMVFSAFWDVQIMKIPLHSLRILGIGLALVGAVLAALKN